MDIKTKVLENELFAEESSTEEEEEKQELELPEKTTDVEELEKDLEIQEKDVVNGLNKWKPRLPDNFSMIVSASRRSGKSYLIRHLYSKYMKHDYVMVFSPNVNEYNFLKDPYFKSSELDIGVLQKLIGREKGKDLRILLIFDDMASRKNRYKDEILQLFIQGRHHNVSVIFITQDITLCDTTWRNNSDIIILMKNKSSKQNESIIDNFLIGYIELEENVKEKRYFRNLLTKNLKGDQNKFKALILDDEFDDEIFWYKAPKANLKVKDVDGN